MATSGCGGGSADVGGECRATIGTNHLPIAASSQVVEFLPDGQARLPARPSAKVQVDVAKIQGALKDEVASTPASAVAEAWRSDGRAVIARLIPGAYLVTLDGSTVRKGGRDQALPCPRR
jgi:hypothetical protein